jgi:hypothetical protein
VGFDPQHIWQREKIPLSSLLYIVPTIFIQATGEELFKMAIFLGCCTLLPVPKRFKIILSLGTSAVIFAGVHFVAWGWNCVLPIMIGSIPSYLVFYYFRNLNLTIWAHILTNLISLAIILEGYGEDFFWVIIVMLILTLVYLSAYYRKKIYGVWIS